MHGCNNNERIQRRRTLFPFFTGSCAISISFAFEWGACTHAGVRACPAQQTSVSLFLRPAVLVLLFHDDRRRANGARLLAALRVRQKNGLAKLCLCGAIVEGRNEIDHVQPEADQGAERYNGTLCKGED